MLGVPDTSRDRKGHRMIRYTHPVVLAIEDCRKAMTKDQATRFPVVAARRYFRALRPTTDLHTAYTQALAYYAALTAKAK
jgi:hypothetical protein